VKDIGQSPLFPHEETQRLPPADDPKSKHTLEAQSLFCVHVALSADPVPVPIWQHPVVLLQVCGAVHPEV
jgi:hypothetical protein